MVPILLDIPDHFETERLLVRSAQPGDGTSVCEAVRESLSELRAWPASLPWALHDPSPDDSEVFCRTGHSAFLARTDFPMLVFLKGTNVLVGSVGIHRIDWAVPKGEIGYWGRRKHLRRGLITEAVRGMTQFALVHLGMRRVECLPDAENMPSRSVAERAGFTLEGVLRHERIAPDGTLRNTCVYSVTA